MRTRAILSPLSLVLLCSCASAPPPAPAASPPLPSSPPPALTSGAGDARAGVEAFNRSLIDVTTRMDNAGVLALWEDDGVSLLPSTRPIAGKKALGAFLDEVNAQLPGARMRSFEMQCAGIEIAGDVASEYCDEHQVVDLGGGKPPFDGTGKMLLVLHRGADGKWRLRREMWNQGLGAAR